MAARYNAGEILEIARQIERNGERFYRRAAEAAEAPSQALLLDLADRERQHERVFADMAAELTSEERQASPYDPNDDVARYLRAVAGGHVFDLRVDPVDWLGQERTIEEVLRKAIELEKDSVIYYLGLGDVVPARLGREAVDQIIRQEMNHMTLLSRALQRAGQ